MAKAKVHKLGGNGKPPVSQPVSGNQSYGVLPLPPGFTPTADVPELIDRFQLGRFDPLALAEMGRSGLWQFSGYVREEFHRDLGGDRALKAYREMAENSATAGAVLRAIEMIMRRVDWRVTPASDSREDQRAADLVDTARHDMSMSWVDTISEICTFLIFGFSYHEQVYKVRNGPYQDSDGSASRYNDGLYGWRKLPIRAQETRLRWEFDPQDGGIKGLWQLSPPDFRQTFIPITKALLFRPRVHKNNPEGQSVLRTAYRAWYMLKRLEDIEAIGIERNLSGLPVIHAPAELFQTGRTPAQAAIYETLKNIGRDVRMDEQACVLMPLVFDPTTNQPLYKFELMAPSGGSREADADRAITRYNQQIAQSVLADFILMGHQKVGSFALSGSKTSIFNRAVHAWLDTIAETFNRYAIPRLLGLNGMRLDNLPVLAHGDPEMFDLKELGDLITALSGAGMPLFPDRDLENWIREELSWPEVTEDQYLEREQERQDQAAKDQQATARSQLLQALDEQAKATAQPQPPAVTKREVINVEAPHIHVEPAAPPAPPPIHVTTPPVQVDVRLPPVPPAATGYVARQQADGTVAIEVIRGRED